MLELSNLPSLPIAVGDNTPTAILVSGVDFYVFRVDNGTWSPVYNSATQPIVLIVPEEGCLVEVTSNSTFTVLDGEGRRIIPADEDLVIESVTLTRSALTRATLGIYIDEACTIELQAPGTGQGFSKINGVWRPGGTDIHIPSAHLDVPGTVYIKVVGTGTTFKNAALACEGLVFTPSAIAELDEGITPVTVARITVPDTASIEPYSITFDCEEWYPDETKVLTVLPVEDTVQFGETFSFDIFGDDDELVIVNNQEYTSPCTILVFDLPAGDTTIYIWTAAQINARSILVHVVAVPRAVISIDGNSITGSCTSVDVNGITVFPPCAIPPLTTKRFNYERNVYVQLTNVVGYAEIGDGEADIVYSADAPSDMLSKDDPQLFVVNNPYSSTDLKLYKTINGYKSWTEEDNSMWYPAKAIKFNDMWLVLSVSSARSVVRASYDCLSWWDSPFTLYTGEERLLNLEDAIIAIGIRQIPVFGAPATWITLDGITWTVFTGIDHFYAACAIKSGANYFIAGHQDTAPYMCKSTAVTGPYTPVDIPLGVNQSIRQIIALESGDLYALVVDNSVYFGGSTTGTKKILQSTDGGNTWVSILLPSTAPGKLYATLSEVFLALNDNSHVYGILGGQNVVNPAIQVIGSDDTQLLGYKPDTKQVYGLTALTWFPFSPEMATINLIRQGEGSIEVPYTYHVELVNPVDEDYPRVDVNGITVRPPCLVPNLLGGIAITENTTITAILSNVRGHAVIGNSQLDVVYEVPA